MKLKIFPKKQGEITILGIRYTLSGLISTLRLFQKKGKQLNNTQEERIDSKGVYAPDVSLKLIVTSPMPVLDAMIHNIPETMLSGQVIQCALELNNKGHEGLCALYVKTSDPHFFSFGDATNPNTPVYGIILLNHV